MNAGGSAPRVAVPFDHAASFELKGVPGNIVQDVINISSDAAVTPYAGWGAYGASKAALLHMSRIWDEELAPHGVRVLSVDPGDMDTPLHAQAVPDADPATLKQPHVAAQEIIALIERTFDAQRRAA